MTKKVEGRRKFIENEDGTIPDLWDEPRPPLREVPEELKQRRKDTLELLDSNMAPPGYGGRASRVHAPKGTVARRDSHDPFREYDWRSAGRDHRGESHKMPARVRTRVRSVRRDWLSAVYADVRPWEKRRQQAVDEYLKEHNLRTRWPATLMLLFLIGPFGFVAYFIFELLTPNFNLPAWVLLLFFITIPLFVGAVMLSPDEGIADSINNAKPRRRRRK